MHNNAKSFEYEEVVEQDGTMISVKLKPITLELNPFLKEFEIYVCSEVSAFQFIANMLPRILEA